MQASLPQELVPLGATVILFGVSMSGAVFLAIGQAVFTNRLSTNLARVVPDSVVQKVLSVGADAIKSVVDAENLAVVLQAYSKTCTQVFVRSSSTLPLLKCKVWVTDCCDSILVLLHQRSVSCCCWARNGPG